MTLPEPPLDPPQMSREKELWFLENPNATDLDWIEHVELQKEDRDDDN